MSEKLYPLKLYITQKINLMFVSASLALNVIIWLWIFFQIKPQKELIFLHYNILFGVDLIGDWWKVYYLPAIGLIILFINYFVGWIFFDKDKFRAYLLNFVSIICQIFLFVASALLVLLNV